MELGGEAIMKNNIWESFKDKRVRYGGYASMMTAFVVAILIIINLMVGQFDYKLDLTENKMFSLSQQTLELLDRLDQNITVYVLTETGKENLIFDETLKQYSAHSNKIKVEYKDPVLYPQFATKYDKEGKGISNDSLIVEGENGKFKIIPPSQLFNYSYNSGSYIVESLAVEERVTGAIQYIISEKNPVIYTLKGHDEPSLPYYVKTQLEKENYEIKDLNLLTDKEIPEDADILMIYAPVRDISKEEGAKITEFLENQGRAIILTNVLTNVKEDQMPNLQEVLKKYGLSIRKSMILEMDAKYQFANPLYIIPNLQGHEITNPLKSSGLPVLVAVAQNIETLQVKRDSLEISPLLTSSETSYAKTNFQSEVAEKEEGDIDGPLDIAVAVTDTWYENNEEKITKLVVVGNTEFLNETINAQSAGGNIDFFMNTVNWLVDKEESISIRPKSLLTTRLKINVSQVYIYVGITVVLIPLIIGIIGLTVWLRRRNR